MKPRTLVAPQMAIGLLAACGLARAQVLTFTNIGPFPAGYGTELHGGSADGLVAVGYGQSSTLSQRAIRWTRPTGIVNLGVPSGASFSQAFAASADGSVVVGLFQLSTGSNRAFRWTSAAGMQSLGTPPLRSDAEALSVSNDGSVIVGRLDGGGTPLVFRWTNATGMQSIGTVPGVLDLLGEGFVSGDGQVIVGSGGTTGTAPGYAFRYVNGGFELLPTPNGFYTTRAHATNSDGSFVVGDSNPQSPPYLHAVRWRVGAGADDLGLLPGGLQSVAYGVSNDGSVVVGEATYASGGHPSAFVWTQAGGMRDLNVVLQSMGVDLQGLILEEATGISADGTVIVGYGEVGYPGPSRGFVVDLSGDRDGDGLRDDWEINGIPYMDAGGVAQRYALPGADPAHKDLYVELDRMTGISVDNAAIAMAVQAFADSPLTNPDGATGINLHVQIDEADLPYVQYWHTSNGCWPDAFDDNFVGQHYGTAAERADPRGLPLRVAKRKAYRYGVLSDQSDADLGGCGKIDGDFFTVYTGGAGPATVDQAAAFMHELGHNLGLHHGGSDDYNGKPNYPSIMNYTLSYRAPWNSDFWRLDYSRVGPEGFATLDELHLNEQTGIGTLLGFYHGFAMPYGVNVAPSGPRALRYVLLNGSPTDFGSPNGNGVPDGQFDTDVIQDLNFLANPPPGVYLPSTESGGDLLLPYNDWAHVVLATNAARGASAPLPSIPTGELQMTARDWMALNFPPPGGGPPCYANCDNSTTSPVLNVLDFSCFLNKYAAGDPYANCDNSTTPPVLNVLDFSCFLNRYAAGCP